MVDIKNIKEILTHIENNIKSVINEDSPEGKQLWNALLSQHSADIAELIEKIDEKNKKKLFKKLPKQIAIKVFTELSEYVQAFIIHDLDQNKITTILQKMPSDELTDLLELLPDKESSKYLKMIQKTQRDKIISLLHLPTESAGRMMDSDVTTLQRDFTVKKSISLIQKIGLAAEGSSRKIYVTNKDNVLVGHIYLEDLVINKSETPLTKIIHKPDLVIDVHEDQEKVAKEMHHYGLMLAPVVDKENQFLGVITPEDVVDIVEEEASEDLYKVSGLHPVEHSYFQTSFSSLFFQRSIWLGSLLLLQSVSPFILSKYKDLIDAHIFLSFFYTMLIGTGGNAGNQSAMLVIRGLATGEITRSGAIKVMVREFSMSGALALVLFLITSIRVYLLYPNIIATIAIGISLSLIVTTSMLLGAFMPFLLERFNIDPAHSAAPFLATVMDIIGILIYCNVCSWFLGV